MHPRRPHAPALALLLSTTLLMTAFGCGASDDAGDRAGAPIAAELTSEQRELLEALGYVYFSRDEPTDQSGVVLHDRTRVSAGLNLYSIRYRCQADLVDMEGLVIHTWRHEPCRFWSTAELLPNGDLLVTGMDPTSGPHDFDPAAMYLLRLSWDGDLLWKRSMAAHHDAEQIPSGELLTLVSRPRPEPRVHPRHAVEDEVLTLLSPGGEVKREVSILDIVLRRGSGFRRRRIRPRPVDGQPVIQIFHANAVEWIDRPELAKESPVYAEGNVLTCLRNQDRVLILSFETGQILWSWGLSELQLPHHPTLLESGNVLIFDNGIRRKWSRVVEVDPRTDRIVWTYQTEPRSDFYSENRGSNQRLPNGNTLISDSDSGRAFEVTAEGETVWEFYTPYVDDQGRRATIERIHRYDPAEIAPLGGGS